MQHMPDPLYPNTKNIQHAKSMQRTQPALPGTHLPTAPIAMPHTPIPALYMHPSPPKGKMLVHALLRFLLLGILLEGLLLALYPLFAYTAQHSDAMQAALLSLFPWLRIGSWSNMPFIAGSLAPFPLLNPNSMLGNANLQLLIFVLAGLILLLTFVAGWQVAKERLTATNRRVIFWSIFLFTIMFSVTCLFVPVHLTAFSQDTLLYGLYGRMVVFYHVNPYSVAPIHSPAAAMHDPLLTSLGLQASSNTTQAGPVWIDLSLLIALFAGNSLANTIIGFRLLGLLAHIINVVLLWAVLTRIKPEQNGTSSTSSTSTMSTMCIPATLLYAWNPLVLLYSIPFMHSDVVVVTFLLLALFFYQRGSLTVGWAFTLFASLVNPLCLLLLPIFFRFMLRESRMKRVSGRVFWWLGMLSISILVVVLAYAPYWQHGSLLGMLDTVRRPFIQSTAINSIDASLLHLPVQLPGAIQWMLAPSHWSLFILGIVSLFLLFATWLADTFTLALLFNSWMLLLLVVLLPVFWPWYLLPLLALALCTGNQRTLILTLLLCLSSLATYYASLWPTSWATLGLVTIGMPLLLCGWLLFFTATWQMTSKEERERPRKGRSVTQTMPGFSRPPWLSRPSRPGKSHY